MARFSLIRVYVAGPIRGKNPTPALMTRNVNKALDAGCVLLKMGVNAYVPHLDYFLAKRNPSVFEGWTTKDWMKMDLPWLRLCNAVLRLPGYSQGSDEEVRYAKTLGIPVFYSIEEVDEWLNNM